MSATSSSRSAKPSVLQSSGNAVVARLALSNAGLAMKLDGKPRKGSFMDKVKGALKVKKAFQGDENAAVAAIGGDGQQKKKIKKKSRRGKATRSGAAEPTSAGPSSDENAAPVAAAPDTKVAVAALTIAAAAARPAANTSRTLLSPVDKSRAPLSPIAAETSLGETDLPASDPMPFAAAASAAPASPGPTLAEPKALAEAQAATPAETATEVPSAEAAAPGVSSPLDDALVARRRGARPGVHGALATDDFLAVAVQPATKMVVQPEAKKAAPRAPSGVGNQPDAKKEAPLAPSGVPTPARPEHIKRLSMDLADVMDEVVDMLRGVSLSSTELEARIEAELSLERSLEESFAEVGLIGTGKTESTHTYAEVIVERERERERQHVRPWFVCDHCASSGGLGVGSPVIMVLSSAHLRSYFFYCHDIFSSRLTTSMAHRSPPRRRPPRLPPATAAAAAVARRRRRPPAQSPGTQRPSGEVSGSRRARSRRRTPTPKPRRRQGAATSTQRPARPLRRRQRQRQRRCTTRTWAVMSCSRLWTRWSPCPAKQARPVLSPAAPRVPAKPGPLARPRASSPWPCRRCCSRVRPAHGAAARA